MKKFKILLPLFLVLSMASAYAESFAVIVNAGNSEEVNIRERFLLQQGLEKWGSGAEVMPFEIDEAGSIKNLLIKKAFLKSVLSMSGKSEWDQYWTDQKSNGRTVRPTKLKSFKKILRFVKREPGGIGYVPVSMVNASVKKVLTFEVN